MSLIRQGRQPSSLAATVALGRKQHGCATILHLHPFCNTFLNQERFLQVLLSKGAKVYIATRSGEKSQAAIEELRRETGKESIFFLKLDLSDLVSVKAAAEEFIKKESELHTLYNNG